MKRTLTTIQKKASKVLLLAILAGAITSCDSVLNYNEDCDIEYCVKFKYDYNMEEVDVFAEQVRTVSLYAFDENNNLVYLKTDEGEQLGDGNYVMNVDIDPSQYRLIVWAGLNDESFAYLWGTKRNVHIVGERKTSETSMNKAFDAVLSKKASQIEM